MAPLRPVVLGAVFAAGAAAGRLIGSQQVHFARMAGWSIAAPDAVGWVTDFLNAAYYRRPPEGRDVDDLRLALAIVTTRWYRGGGRRLRAADVLAFHRAFGRDRMAVSSTSGRGRLDRDQLLAGGARLLGDWFPGAYADRHRRGWGIAFPTREEHDAYDPELRLRAASLGTLTPEAAPLDQQTWHTYAPVEVPSAPAALGILAVPERWPDLATEIGRFTPVRPGGLADQTFEIEVAAGTEAGRPIFTRGYVTVTRVLLRDDDPEAVDAYVEELNAGLLARPGETEAVPGDATTLLALDLTTHAGHFMGAGHNRLLLYRRGDRAFLRAAGTWDPMPWHLASAYALAGREAQHRFWGAGREEQSLLRQVARAIRDGADA